MLQIGSNARVFIAVGPTDMRKSINGLSILVEAELDGELFGGDYFVFCNRAKSIIKILYWDRSGFCLWQKTLDKGRYHWPMNEQDLMRVRAEELMWLLEGLDIAQAHERLNYNCLT